MRMMLRCMCVALAMGGAVSEEGCRGGVRAVPLGQERQSDAPDSGVTEQVDSCLPSDLGGVRTSRICSDATDTDHFVWVESRASCLTGARRSGVWASGPDGLYGMTVDPSEPSAMRLEEAEVHIRGDGTAGATWFLADGG